MTMTSIHACGRTVQFVMPRQMGSFTCDLAKNPQPAAADDVWATMLALAGLFECPPGEVGAARYRLHRCQERAA